MENELPIRKNIRLRNYDYSQNGCYFITVCVKDRHCVLWEGKPVGANRVRPLLSEIGKIVEKEILNISHIYEFVKIDKYVIMPNHIHMILIIQNDDLGQGVEGDGRTRFAPTISRIIKQTKGLATKQIGFSLWQRSFHDHIIRSEEDYWRIWQYIDENPQKWGEDYYFQGCDYMLEFNDIRLKLEGMEKEINDLRDSL